eukprot:15463656-Alexandrium_andersonii.AAC.1
MWTRLQSRHAAGRQEIAQGPEATEVRDPFASSSAQRLWRRAPEPCPNGKSMEIKAPGNQMSQ